MSLNLSDIAGPMLAAAKTSLDKDWGKAQDFAKSEFKRLAVALVDISKLAASGKVNKQQTKILLKIHKNTTQVVLLGIEGLGLIAVENAINAALGSVAGTVNGALGFKLL